MGDPLLSCRKERLLPRKMDAHFIKGVDAEANMACLMMCRTTLIALQRERKVSSLKELRDNGTIGGLLYCQSEQVSLWANLLGHEEVLPQSVSLSDAEQLLAYVEMLLDTVYFQPARLAGLEKKRSDLKRDPR